MEDVWIINKEYQSSGMKNMNKLPSKLVEKIINYSSDKNDMVCDFFMGSFTTADCALRLGRNTCGFELNKIHTNTIFSKMSEIDFGIDYLEPKKDDHFPIKAKPLLTES
jgi:site-specific DNA-methyltransferase (adenine-specific)